MSVFEATHCDHCGDDLEDGQSGLCEDCEDVGKVAAEHNVLCPKCGDDRQLEVVAEIWVVLVEDGTEDSDDGDQDYDDNSHCRCRSCNWSGNYGQMRQAYAVKADPVLARLLDYAKQEWGWDDAPALTEMYRRFWLDVDTPEAFVDCYAVRHGLTRAADVLLRTKGADHD